MIIENRLSLTASDFICLRKIVIDLQLQCSLLRRRPVHSHSLGCSPREESSPIPLAKDKMSP